VILEGRRHRSRLCHRRASRLGIYDRRRALK
jgi:hypothetical protein